MAEAMRLFTLAATGNHLLGQYYLGLMNVHGIGTPGNYKFCQQGTMLLKAVAEKGREAQIVEKAHEAFVGGHANHALIKYLFAAEWGFDVAQVNAAYLLERTPFEHNTTDLERSALINWKRAAQQGSVDAKVRVGDYYYYGQGLTVDYAEAAAHYSEAEQKHSAQAMFNLGYMHERGEGLAKDLHLAKRFYDKAIVTGEEAYLPATLSLLLLGVKLLLNGELSFYLYGDEKAASAAAAAGVSAGAAKVAEASPVTWATFFRAWEDDLVIVLLVFLVLLVAIRRRL